jgi:DNA-binding Lrp family transcriptional regulator
MRNEQREQNVISWLRKNARISLTRLSRKTRVPISTLHDHIKTNEKAGIYRHVTLVDFRKLGFGIKAYVLVRCKANKQDLGNKLSLSVNVNNLFRINNGYDYLMECIAHDMTELESFLAKLEEQFDIQNQVFFVLESLRREAFLTAENSGAH